MCAYVYVCKCVIWKQEKTAHILQCLVNTYQNTYHHGTRKLSSGWDTPPKIWKLIGIINDHHHTSWMEDKPDVKLYIDALQLS